MAVQVSVSHRPAKRRIVLACQLESLENRCLLSGTPVAADDELVTIDPELLAKLQTPKLRRPGRHVSVADAGVLPDTGLGSPATSTSWDAVNFDTNAAAAGSYFIPPDNSGAAGPAYVVNVVNCSIQWYTKSGSLSGSMRLGRDATTASGSFFAPLSPVNTLFDPKVVYDQYNNRFVVVALEQRDTGTGDTVNSSRILIAVSDDADPNGSWYYQAIDSNLTIGGQDYWADYPGFAVDANAIYVTANMFGYGLSTFGGSRLWILGKNGLYTGSTGQVNVYDPSTLASLPDDAGTLQPAQMYGAAPGTTGTFLVSSGWTTGGTEQISVIRVQNPLFSPTFTNTFVNVGDISSAYSPAATPQRGTSSTIDSGDGRIYNAVWRNNSLYFANTVSPVSGVDAGTATAHWYRFTANSSAVSLADQGNISGEEISAAARTFYPAVTVDAAGDMAVGFSAAGPSLYAGAYYSFRLATDAAGTLQPAGTLMAGLDSYVRTFGATNPWGDYSAIALDPANEYAFWVFNQYAQTRGTSFGGEDGRWATRWGTFAATPASGAPGTPSLASLYDTGASGSDGLTRYNNAADGSRLLFNVPGTTAGATVRIYANGVLLGSAVAAGTSAFVLTNGVDTLADGTYVITARLFNGATEGPDSLPYTLTIDSSAPAITAFKVNGGAAQRSMVTSLAVSFSERVSTAAMGAMALWTHAGASVPNVTVGSSWSADLQTVTLTFSGSAIVAGSLPDGVYDLITTASLVADRAGNPLAANDTRTFHRLFGDADGNRIVNALDYARLKQTFGRASSDPLFNSAFDYDSNGLINALDLARFRQRYGMSFSY